MSPETDKCVVWNHYRHAQEKSNQANYKLHLVLHGAEYKFPASMFINIAYESINPLTLPRIRNPSNYSQFSRQNLVKKKLPRLRVKGWIIHACYSHSYTHTYIHYIIYRYRKALTHAHKYTYIHMHSYTLCTISCLHCIAHLEPSNQLIYQIHLHLSDDNMRQFHQNNL